MNTKIDLKIEAARLAIEKGMDDFSTNARTIYDFLTDGLNIPDNEPGIDCMINTIQSMFPAISKKDENSAAKPVED